MARLSLIEREKKRERTVKAYAKKRAALKVVIDNVQSTAEEKWKAQLALQKLPRNASPTRLRNRCGLTGRSRGVYSKFGLGRSKLREVAMFGDVPGLTKASW